MRAHVEVTEVGRTAAWDGAAPAATVVVAVSVYEPWLAAVRPVHPSVVLPVPNVAIPPDVLADSVELPSSFSPAPTDDSVTDVVGSQLTRLPSWSSTTAVTGGHM